MIVSLIATIDRELAISQDGRYPWDIPADVARFDQLTHGHHVILGRQAYFDRYLDQGATALLGRRVIVLTGNPERYRPILPPTVELVTSMQAALAIAKAAKDTEVFLAGGSEVYDLGMAYADRLYLTRINTQLKTGKIKRFPRWIDHRWLVQQTKGPYLTEGHTYSYQELVYTPPKDEGRIRVRTKTRATHTAVTPAESAGE